LADEGEVGGWWGAEVREFVDAGRDLPLYVAGVHEDAEEREDGEDDEYDEVQNEHDGAEDAEAVELPWEKVHNYAEDARVHGYYEPGVVLV
jgi:hypothetical protein